MEPKQMGSVSRHSAEMFPFRACLAVPLLDGQTTWTPPTAEKMEWLYSKLPWMTWHLALFLRVSPPIEVTDCRGLHPECQSCHSPGPAGLKEVNLYSKRNVH